MLAKTLTFVFVTLVTTIFFYCVPTKAIAQWKPTNGPAGADITNVVTLGSNLFVGTGSGVFRSTDSGSSWQRAGLKHEGIRALASNGQFVFASVLVGKVFRTSDYGVSWTEADSGLVAEELNSFAVSGPIVYAAEINDGGIFQTSDNGIHWSPLDSGLNRSVDAICEDSNVMYAATWTGLFRSTDSGKYWNKASEFTFNQYNFYFVNTYGNRVFAGSTIGLYESSDEGASWKSCDSGLPASIHPTAIGFVNSDVVLGTSAGIFRSTYSGSSWSLVNKDFRYSIRKIITIQGNILAGTSDGMWVSEDHGQSWRSSNKGMMAPNVTSLTTNGFEIFAGTSGAGVFATPDNGITWSEKNNGLAGQFVQYELSGLTVNSLACRGPELLAGTGMGTYYSTDKGANWRCIDTNIWSFSVAFYGQRIFGARDAKWTEDTGKTWHERRHECCENDTRVLLTNDPILFAGCDNSSEGGAVVFTSSDSGSTWKAIPYPGVVLDWNGVAGIARSGPFVFTATWNGGIFRSGGIYRIRLGDSAWTLLNTGSNVTGGGPLIYSGSKLFAATQPAGILLSIDNGETWMPVNTGLQDDSTSISCFTIKDDYLYAGIYGGGVWRRPLSEMIGSSAVEKPRALSQLNIQSYPNPSSQSTTISFSAEEREPAKVTILNLLGEEVYSIYDGELEAGEHSFTWDCRNAAAGSYFCVVRTGDRVERLAVIVVR